MSGSDTYCFITGARYMNSTTEICDDILEECYNRTAYQAGRRKGKGRPISSRLYYGLCYHEEDVKASAKFVMICCYERHENGQVRLLSDIDDEAPTEVKPENVKELFNVVPGRMVEYREYKNLRPEERDLGEYSIHGEAPKVLITQRAYVILKQASPMLKPHILLRLQHYFNTLDAADSSFFPSNKFIDYGPVKRTQTQHADWLSLYNAGSKPDPLRQNEVEWWKNLLSNRSKSVKSILRKAWRGRGNMWCLVSPSRFPIADSASGLLRCPGPEEHDTMSSLTALPLDILITICEMLHPRYTCALISTCRSIRMTLMKAANQVVRGYITRCEPWFLPAGPFDIPHGADEVNDWASEWKEVRRCRRFMESRIPWLAYRRACSHSLSMWNRIRIWRVIHEMEDLAFALDFMD